MTDTVIDVTQLLKDAAVRQLPKATRQLGVPGAVDATATLMLRVIAAPDGAFRLPLTIIPGCRGAEPLSEEDAASFDSERQRTWALADLRATPTSYITRAEAERLRLVQGPMVHPKHGTPLYPVYVDFLNTAGQRILTLSMQLEASDITGGPPVVLGRDLVQSGPFHDLSPDGRRLFLSLETRFAALDAPPAEPPEGWAVVWALMKVS